MRALFVVDGGTYPASMLEAATGADDDDATLARRITSAAPATDPAAEAELCRRLAPRVRLYGLKHLRSAAAAADLVQDVLLVTLQKLRAGDVREPAQIVSFVFGACKQTVVDGRRTVRRRERILGEFPLDLSPNGADEATELDTDRLVQCLGRLPERERAVLVMTFYEDRPADAVGD